MILVDSIYINSYGGLYILKAFVKGLNNYSVRKSDFHFLIDDRIDIESIKELKMYNTIKVKPNHFNRRKIYKTISKEYDTILCLSNIPPPFKVDKPVFIYFHNLLLIKSNLELSTPINLFLNYIKSLYINFFNNNSYIWVTQTEHCKFHLSKKFNIKSNLIKVLPFYETGEIKFKKRDYNSNTLNYLCVTNNSKHKNVPRLTNAFLKSNFSSQKKVTLLLTTNGKDVQKENKKIKYLGFQDKKNLIKCYYQSHYIVFPSLIESFGLPIIEGIQSGANILSSDIDSIKEVAIPSIIFNANKELDIKMAFENSSKHIYKYNSTLLIKNEINNFIKLITHNV